VTLPNFLVIGAAKSGTSALYNYLWQHPDIYMSPFKEPGFFVFEGQRPDFRGPGDWLTNRLVVTDRVPYEALFDGVTTEKAIGEASAIYLYHSETPCRIQATIPHARLIAILRNPADRAFSAFQYTTRDGREPLTSFAEALAAETERVAANWAHIWHYRQFGFYYQQLQRYFDRFPREQLVVFTYDEFTADPKGVLKSLFHFLDVDPSFKPDLSLRYNVSGRARFKRLQQFLIKPSPLKEPLKALLPVYTRRRLVNRALELNVRGQEKAVLDPTDRCDLLEGYREDICQLETLIQKDLSHWLDLPVL
jgi:hypothetical protein